MPQSFDSIQFSFGAGELAPNLRARSDQNYYQHGLAEGWNFLVTPDGSLRTRPGTQWISDVETAGVTLQRFYANNEEDGNDFLLLFTPTKLEIYRDKEVFQTIVAPNYPFTGQYGGFTFAQNENVMTVLHKNQEDPWELRYHNGRFTLEETPLESVLTPPTNVQSGLLTELYTGQEEGTEEEEEEESPSVDAVYVVTAVDASGHESPGSAPLLLTGLKKEGYSVVLIWDEVPQAVYYNIYRSSIGTNLFTSAPVALAASRVTTPYWTDTGGDTIDLRPPLYENLIVPGTVIDTVLEVNGQGYSRETSVFIEASLRGGGAVFEPIIGQDGTIEQIAIIAGGAGYDNPRLSFTDTGGGTGAEAYTVTTPIEGLIPNAVAYYQQRRLFGGNAYTPLRIWASQIGNYRLFTLSSIPTPDSPFKLDINAADQNPIRHIIAMPSGLFIFTASGVWRVYGETFAVGHLSADPILYDGSTNLKPLTIHGGIMYVEKEEHSVLRVEQGRTATQYEGVNVGALSSHLFDPENPIVSWSYKQPYLWAVLLDGTMLCLTYSTEKQILAWTKHRTDFRNKQNLGRFLQVEATSDGVYVLVSRQFEKTSEVAPLGDALLLGSGTPLLLDDFVPMELSAPEDVDVCLSVKNPSNLLEVRPGVCLRIDTRKRRPHEDGTISLEFLSFDEIGFPETWTSMDSWREINKLGELQKLAGDPALIGRNRKFGLKMEAEFLTLPVRLLETPTGQLRLGLGKLGQIYSMQFMARGGIPRFTARPWKRGENNTVEPDPEAKTYTPEVYLSAEFGTQVSICSVSPGDALHNSQVKVQNQDSEPIELLGYSFEVEADPRSAAVVA